MTKVVYQIVKHDGGWAYRLDGAYSETFSTHEDALAAARIVAAEQQVGGEPEEISWQDAKGNWHTEYSDGGDRPEAEVVDDDEGQSSRAFPAERKRGSPSASPSSCQASTVSSVG